MSLLEVLHRAGWNPLEPSKECVEATTCPEMPVHLTALDVLGVNRQLIALEMLHRFLNELRQGEWVEDQAIITDEATRHAMREAGHDLRALRPETFERIRMEMSAWLSARFRASSLLCKEVMGKPRTKAVAVIEREVGPAFTFVRLWHARGWTDFEGNRRAAASMHRLGEKRGVMGRPSELAKLDEDLSKLPKWIDEEVEKLLHVLTAKDPGQRIFVRKGRTMCIGETEARDALEKVISPVEPVRQKIRRRTTDPSMPPVEPNQQVQQRRTETAERVQGFEEESGVTSREPNPSAVVEQDELASVARSWLRDRRDRAESGSVEATAAEWLLRQETDAPAIQSIAQEKNVHPTTLGHACRAVQTELERHLTARTRSD